MYTHWKITRRSQKKAISTVLGNEFEIVGNQGQRFFSRGARVFEFSLLGEASS